MAGLLEHIFQAFHKTRSTFVSIFQANYETGYVPSETEIRYFNLINCFYRIV